VLALVAAPALRAAVSEEPKERIAWVRMATGSVEVRPAGNPIEPVEPLVQIGQSLFSGDTIRTGPKGQAVIQFTDGSRLYCFEEAELTISEGETTAKVLGFEVERYKRRLIDVVRGAVGVAVEPNEERSTEVESPTAVVGVRGTLLDPFRYDAATGETLVGLKRGKAWGYTPDRQAAFEITPGLLARAGRDALGRSTLRSEQGLLGLVTRDHKIELQRGQGVFLDLETARGRAVIGALRGSVGRVAVEAGENRAFLEARQSLKSLVDRKKGKVSLESLQGKLPVTDRLGRKSLLVPGKPSELQFKPPAFEPRVIPGPRPKAGPPGKRPSGRLPGVKGKPSGSLAPERPEVLKRPSPRAPGGTPGKLKVPGKGATDLPKSPSHLKPAVKGVLKSPSSARPRLPKAPQGKAGKVPSPLKRLLQKAIPPRTGPPPTEEPGKAEGLNVPPIKSTREKEPSSKTPYERKGLSDKPLLAPKKAPLVWNPFEMLRR
jgi:hypothetical protein